MPHCTTLKSDLSFFAIPTEDLTVLKVFKTPRSLLGLGKYFTITWLTNRSYPSLTWVLPGSYLGPTWVLQDVHSFSENKFDESPPWVLPGSYPLAYLEMTWPNLGYQSIQNKIPVILIVHHGKNAKK